MLHLNNPMTSSACRIGKLPLFLLAFVVLPSCQVMPGRTALDTDAPTRGTVSLDREAEAKQAEEDEQKFDTKEERLKVPPLNWDETKGKPKSVDFDKGDWADDTRPGQSGGGMPAPAADREARKYFPDQWSLNTNPEQEGRLQRLDLVPSDGEVHHIGTKDVFTQFGANPHTQYPRRTIGKLFTNAGSCSASVVSGKNAIVTAAHCCYNRSGNDWIRGWSFAPAYSQGNTPYGQFGWASATILTAWISSGTRPTDVCVIKLRNNQANRPVTYYTGWLGRSWNYPSIQDHFALGYPGNIGGGQSMQLCTSESFSPSSSCGGNGVLNTGCSMTYGASGGPWVRNYNSNSWVNSVVSGYDSSSCTGSFGETFNGPRFTTGNIKTICDAAGC